MNKSQQMAEEKFTALLWRKTRNLPDYTNFAVSLRDELVYDKLLIFYPIFAFLEDAKERLKMSEYDKLFVHKSLFKKKAFEDDLAFYLGEFQFIFNERRVQNYIEHLKKLEKEDPKCLLVYIYYLYLGLLRGGQIMNAKRKLLEVQLSYNIKDDSKVAGTLGFHAEVEEMISHMNFEEKTDYIIFLVQNYHSLKKKNNRNYKIIKKPFRELLKEMEKLKLKQKIDILNDTYHFWAKIYIYVEQSTYFAGADISQIKKDFRAAMNEIAKDFTEEQKSALLLESHKVFQMNKSMIQPETLCCII